MSGVDGANGMICRNVKKDLGPLLDAMTAPLFQIVSGVGLLLNGVLTLLGNIVRIPRGS